MEITAKLLKEFITKRLEEEKSKDKNEYWCLSGKIGYGMHYWDHVMKALDPIFEDIDYAMKHPEVFDRLLVTPTKVSINDYDTVEEALNNLYKFHDNYVIEITLIINGNITEISILPCALDDNLSNKIRNELKYKGLPYLEGVFSSKSYYMNFFEEHRSLTIIIHQLGDY